ncbi:MAG: chromosome segregation protein SMC [Ruminococcaceae bacterium]|nr:chromosome segregation protein SMC [Oscillospiraceae bacterium]
MKLIGLEMQGFKSFPDKTRINFDKGITAVIGPNGSGKSNISDAVRWVLGEMSMKSLRGSKMEDVIFSGSDKRTPANYTYVSLYLDSEDGSDEETVVTRKYYRSGESEYYLNKKQVRLKDVYEAFYDTGIGREGYSVIGQGKIAEVLSQKGDERRSIFEEAAGISKFRYKKIEAERKLAATEANLLRIADLVGEIGSRLGPLEKEAENAKKFLALSEEKKGLEISLWLDKIDKVREELNRSEELIAGAAQALVAADEKINSIESGADSLYIHGNEIGKQISETEKQISEIGLKLSAADGKKALKANDIAHYEKLISDSKAEKENSIAEKQRLEDSIGAAEDACLKAETALEEIKTTFADFEASYSEKRTAYTQKTVARNDLQRAYTNALERRTKVSSAFAAVKANLENAKRNAASSAEEISGFESRIAQISEKFEKLKTELVAAKSVLSDAEDAYKNATADVEAADKELAEIKNVNNELALNIASLKQQKENLMRMEALLEGYSDSVKNVINAAKEGKILCKHKNAALHGTVSSVLNTDEKYVVALETALATAVQYVIVDDEEDAKACIRYLKETGGGRASFLPISTVKGPKADVSNLQHLDGYIGIGCDLCKYDAKYKDIFTKLLGETIVASDIDSAAVIARACGYRLRIVTLDGQVIHQGGSFTGGSSAKRVGILTRSIDIERLGNIIASKEKEYKSALQKQEACQEKRDELASACESFAVRVTVAKSKKDSFSNSVSVESMRLEEEKRRYKHFSDSSDGITKELLLLTAEAETKQTELSVAESEAQKLSEQLAVAVKEAELAERESTSFGDELNKMRLQVMEKDNALVRLREKRHSISERCKNISLRIRECELSAQNAVAQIEKSRADIALIEKEEKTYDEEKNALQKVIENLIAGREDNEKKANELRQKLKDAQADKEEAFRYHTTLESRRSLLTGEYEEVSAKLWDEYELTYSTAVQFRLPEENMKKAPSRLNSLKNQIRAMGNINVNAVEEYKETKERYDFYTTQTDDLNKTRRSLDNAIEKLESNMKSAFKQTFVQINTAFGEVFSELFGGGSAKCVLEDEDNPLTCGIDIILRPPGKSIKNINLLSGGEQSFAAVALYLALQRINPAPFCIFDEIESALDEVNVARLASYIKNHSEATQFIMITHRRGTMENADVVYGITMKEKGVSDYIKLDIRALEQNIEYK